MFLTTYSGTLRLTTGKKIAVGRKESTNTHTTYPYQLSTSLRDGTKLDIGTSIKMAIRIGVRFGIRAGIRMSIEIGLYIAVW